MEPYDSMKSAILTGSVDLALRTQTTPRTNCRQMVANRSIGHPSLERAVRGRPSLRRPPAAATRTAEATRRPDGPGGRRSPDRCVLDAARSQRRTVDRRTIKVGQQACGAGGIGLSAAEAELPKDWNGVSCGIVSQSLRIRKHRRPIDTNRRKLKQTASSSGDANPVPSPFCPESPVRPVLPLVPPRSLIDRYSGCDFSAAPRCPADRRSSGSYALPQAATAGANRG